MMSSSATNLFATRPNVEKKGLQATSLCLELRRILLPSPKSSTAVHGILDHRRRQRQRQSPAGLGALRCSSGEAIGEPQLPENPNAAQDGLDSSSGIFAKWKMDSAELRERVAKLGLAAILAYGLFDGVTYTTFFVIAFLGYEKSTGKNPAANLQALLGLHVSD